MSGRHFKLICPRSDALVNAMLPQNAGYSREQVLSALTTLESETTAPEVIEGEMLTDAQRDAFGMEAARWAAQTKTPLGHVFGSRKREYKWQQLGKEVPCLMESEGGETTGVYPHVAGDGFLTIAGFLTLQVPSRG